MNDLTLKLLGIIWWFIRDYSANVYSLSKVTDALIRYMTDRGYFIELVDGKHRDYKIVKVCDHQFRIVRIHGWNSYDVRTID